MSLQRAPRVNTTGELKLKQSDRSIITLCNVSNKLQLKEKQAMMVCVLHPMRALQNGNTKECGEPMTDLGGFVSYIEIDDICHVKSCFSNQLMKINEFFFH